MGPRILIAAGGTDGHVAPALAVAAELTRRGADVVFAGGDRAEARLVPRAGYRLERFPISGLPRRPSPALARALARAAAAPFRCLAIVRRTRPAAVLGGGGYVAGPMVLAARLAGVPAVLTEADAHLGLANRLAAPCARRVFLALPIAGREPPRYAVVGRAVAPEFATTTREAGRAAFGLPPGAPVVAVFGGSLGARELNDAVRDGLAADPPAGAIVLHLTGPGKPADAPPSGRYRPLESTERMPELLAAADLVVARAGGSVWEIAAAGTPAILVPWSGATGGHQAANARAFERAGGAVVEPSLDGPRLRSLVDDLLGDPERLARMAAAMRRAARPEAAATIADELLALAGEQP